MTRYIGSELFLPRNVTLRGVRVRLRLLWCLRVTELRHRIWRRFGKLNHNLVYVLGADLRAIPIGPEHA